MLLSRLVTQGKHTTMKCQKGYTNDNLVKNLVLQKTVHP